MANESITRPYSLQLWSISDSPISVLRSANSNFPGQAYDAKMTRSTSGATTFSCSIPLCYFDNASNDFVKNALWYGNGDSRTKLTSHKKIKVIVYQNGIKEKPNVYEFFIQTVEESHEDGKRIGLITCVGLEAIELGKIGYNINFSVNTVYYDVLDNDAKGSYIVDLNLPNHVVQIAGNANTAFGAQKPIEIISSNNSANVTDSLWWDNNYPNMGFTIGDTVYEAAQYIDGFDYRLVVTPILANGAVLNAAQFENYCNEITTNNNGANTLYEVIQEDKQVNDGKDLILQAFSNGTNLELINATTEYVSKLMNLYSDAEDYLNTTRANINYFLDKIFPSHLDDQNNTIWDTNWKYKVVMNWDKYPDLKNDREIGIIYENPAPATWTIEAGQLVPMSYSFFEEKVRYPTVEVGGNKYNFTQTLAEVFEVFVKYEYEHDENYKITNRTVVFYNDFVKDNFSIEENQIEHLEINYGSNLNGIVKTYEATDLTTKMYVEPIESAYSESGLISIAEATNNPLQDKFLLNFDHFKSLGQLNDQQVAAIDKYKVDLYNVNVLLYQITNNLATYAELENESKAQKTVLEELADSAYQQMQDCIKKIGETKITESGETGGTIFYDVVVNSARPEWFILADDGTGKLSFNFTKKGVQSDSLVIYTTPTCDLGSIISATDYSLTLDNYGFITKVKYTGSALSSNTNVYCTFRYNEIKYRYAIYYDYENLYNQINQDLEKWYNIKNGHYFNNGVDISQKILDTKEQYSVESKNKERLNTNFEKIMGLFIQEGQWQDQDYNELSESKECNLTKIVPPAERDAAAVELFGFYDVNLYSNEQRSYFGGNYTIVNAKYYPYLDLGSYITSGASLENFDFGHSKIKFTYYANSTSEDLLEYVCGYGASYILTFKREGVEGSYTYNPILLFYDTILYSYFTEVNSIELNTVEIYPYDNYQHLGTMAAKVYDANDAGAVNFMRGPIAPYDNAYFRLRLIDRNVNNSNIVIKLRQPNLSFVAGVATNKDTDVTSSVTLDPYYDYIINYEGTTPIFTLKYNNKIKLNEFNFKINYEVGHSAEHLYSDADKVLKENSKPKVSYKVNFNNCSTVSIYQLIYDMGTSKVNIVDKNSKIIQTLTEGDLYNYVIDSGTSKQVLYVISASEEENILTNSLTKKIYNLDLGYIVYINDNELGIFGEKGIVTSLSYDLDSPKDDTVEISNYKTKFEDLFSSIVASSAQLEQSGYTYERAAAAILPTEEIDKDVLQKTLDNAELRMLVAQGSVVIDSNGITLYSTTRV